MKKNNPIIYLIAVFGIVMFSSKAIFIKLAYRFDIDSISLLWLRLFFSVPVYLIATIISARKYPLKSLTLKNWLLLLLLGIMGYYLASLLDFIGLKYISAGLERLILFVYPTLVIVIARIVFKRQILKSQALAIAVTYLGVAIIFIHPEKLDGNTNIPLGSLLVFLSALSYALYLNGAEIMINKIGPVLFTNLVMLFSFLGASFHLILSTSAPLQSYPPEIYLYSVLMSVVATIIPSYLIAIAIKKIGASNFAIIGSLGPVSTLTLAYFFLNETIVIQQIIGGIITILGVTITNLKKSK